LILDAKGDLYGTAGGGDLSCGGGYGCGVVFRLTPEGKETVLYTFTGADGVGPTGVIRDANGNLYGTTVGGGAAGFGVVFKLAPDRKETVLYSFMGPPDGANPNGGLIRDSSGNLYGTTSSGGDSDCGGGYGCGTIFKIGATGGKERVLYTFSAFSNGEIPGGLIMDADGNLYGTTGYGGDQNAPCFINTLITGCGVVFKFKP